MNTDDLIRELHASPLLGVFIMTGGGASTIARLLTVPGASRTVLEAMVPYAEQSLTRFLGQRPDSFCSASTAVWMAERALEHARLLSNAPTLVGVSCTASLATDRPKKGDHRAHLGFCTDSRSFVDSITFHKDQRTRDEEEAVIQVLVLNALAELAGVTPRLPSLLLPGEVVERSERPVSIWARLHEGAIPYLCQEPDGQLQHTGTPPKLVFPGSFNPWHDGHRRLASIAEQRLGLPLSYELSITNVDKPPLERSEVQRRAHQFLQEAPLWLTRAPRFIDKVQLFPGAAFVIGADTALRLVEPRYYGDAVDCEKALQSLYDQGCRFVVGGRVDPKSGRFVTGESIPIPPRFASMFIILSEAEFRIDLSSTAIRNGAS